jgi:hypothetical protein
MAFSYSDEDLGNGGVSDLRFEIGDTDAVLNARCGLSDEELQYLITDKGSVSAAREPALRRWIRKARTLVNASTGSEREDLSNLAGQLEETLDELVRGEEDTGSAGSRRKLRFLRYTADDVS